MKKATKVLNVFETEGYESDKAEVNVETFLVWTAQNLQVVFEKLFRIAIDLPIDPLIYDETNDIRILFHDELMKGYFLRKQLNDPKVMQFYNFDQFKYKLSYE